MGEQGVNQASPEQLNQYLLVDPTGVPHLDDVLGGGMPRGALAIVVGPPGSGKTTLACQMAFTAARASGSALVLTALSETSTKLIGHLRSFRFYDPLAVGNTIQFLSMEHMLAGGLSATADEMVAIVHQARATLVVLDGFRGVRESEVEAQAARRFLELRRLLSVAKMRFSAHDLHVREFTITSPQGIEVLPRGPIDWDAIGGRVTQQAQAQADHRTKPTTPTRPAMTEAMASRQMVTQGEQSPERRT